MILSIESSCDDSSIAITEISSARLLFHRKISQESTHSIYGGVVPEIASRLHAQALPKILSEVKVFLEGLHSYSKGTHFASSLKAIAVTAEPGLNITLIEGMMMAKALALSLNLPLIAINHLKGHIYSLFINQKSPIFPLTALLVSGGHTLIIEAKNSTEMYIVAKSIDDSFGESFDKVAKMLSLTYPGGPIIEKYAQTYKSPSILSNPKIKKFSFPIPLKHSKELAFSFSGLKNSVRLAILHHSQKEGKEFSQSFISQICANFQYSACEHLLDKLRKYFGQRARENKPIEYFSVVGGASANLYLREQISKLCKNFKVKLLLAPLEFCSDNAAMIGRAGIEKYIKNDFSKITTLQTSPKSTELT